MMEFRAVDGDIVLEGFLGRPTLNRANRNFENYFVNKRYIKSKIISKAIEEGYQSYMMQHRYPFCVVHITIPPENVDVNVHPTKMEVRFANQNSVYKLIAEHVSDFLSRQEMIPAATLGTEQKTAKKDKKAERIAAPEPFEKERRLAEETGAQMPVPNVLREESGYNSSRGSSYDHDGAAGKRDTTGAFLLNNKMSYSRAEDEREDKADSFFVDNRQKAVRSENAEETGQTRPNSLVGKILGAQPKETEPKNLGVIKSKDQIIVEKPEQLDRKSVV